MAALMCPLGPPVVRTGGREFRSLVCRQCCLLQKALPTLAHRTQAAPIGRGKSIHSSSAIAKAGRVHAKEGGLQWVARW